MNIIKSLLKKYYRWKLPDNLRHMTDFYPWFQIHDNQQIIWHNKVVGMIRPLSELKVLAKESCFIIATGPSITNVDLSKIDNNKLIWGVNGAIALTKKQDIKFDIYTIVDSDFIKKQFAMVREVILQNIPCLLSPLNIKLICEREPELLSYNNIYLLQDLNARFAIPALTPDEFDAWARQDSELILSKNLTRQGDRVGFSKNIAKGIFGGGTVVYGVIQAAYYVGVKKVYILGMDLGYSGNKPRFYDEGEKTCHSSLAKYYIDIIEPAFEVLADVCKQKDFKVYNLSQRSRLSAKIIPKLNFANVLNS
jgi:Kdo-III transferase WaaZ